MEAVLGVMILLLLVGGKVWLMRSVWRMAGEQGKSRPLCLAVSFFASLIVYLALRINGHAERHLRQLAEEKTARHEESQ